jgi:hypothetical protein
MTEHELREMVRDSIARLRGADAGPLQPHSVGTHAYATHASFARLSFLRSGDDEGACLIEPTVRCNHCGYCQSYGH